MANRAGKLTDAHLRAYLAAGDPVAVSDGAGLTFTLSASGAAAWVLRYRIGGRRRELTLGRYPDLSLQAARRKASAKRESVFDGVDVAAEKRRTSHVSVSAWTVRQVVEDYTDKVLTTRRASTRRLADAYIRLCILPRLGAMVAADVQRSDVVAMLRANGKRGAGAVRSLHSVTRGVFEHARGLAIRDDNPAAGIKHSSVVSVTRPRKGGRLEGEALAAFLRANPDDTKGDALRLHLLTGVRPAELCEVPWSELDLAAGTWRIGDERSKTGEGYTITLPPQAVVLLHRIRANTPVSAYVFPAARGADRPIPYQTYRAWLWRTLDAAGIARGTIKPHDLRRTMRSGLATLGIRYEVAERAINHKLPGLAEIYDRNDYAVERAAALRQWADYLDALRTGAKVTPIRRMA